jgi:hypothetical protein
MADARAQIEETYHLIDDQLEQLRWKVTSPEEVSRLSLLHDRAAQVFQQSLVATLDDDDPEVANSLARLRQANQELRTAAAEPGDLSQVFDIVGDAIAQSESVMKFGPGAGH